MGHPLRYLYLPGESFEYAVTVHTVVERPDGPEGAPVDLAWRTHTDVTRVVDGVYHCQLMVRGETGQPPRIHKYIHDSLGVVQLEPEDVEGYQRPLSFPDGTIDVGDTWKSSGMDILLADFETADDDVVAVLNISCELDLSEQEAEGWVESVLRFSVRRGRNLNMRSVTLLQFASGRKVTTSSESRLL